MLNSRFKIQKLLVKDFQRKLFFLLLLAKLSACFAQGGFLNTGPDQTICRGDQATLTALASTPPALQLDTISIPNSSTNLSDDQFSNAVNIGFNFNFYGTNFTQCLVSSNTYITFDLSLSGQNSPYSITAASPSPANPINAIMAPWQDVNPATSPNHIIRVGRFGTAPNRVFVAEWMNLLTFQCGNDCNSTQIILYEGSNIIETHIAEKALCPGWNGGAAIHGIQNGNGLIAHIVPGRNFPTQWTCVADGKRFTPSGSNNYAITNIPFAPITLGVAPSASYAWSVLGGAPFAFNPSVNVSPNSTTTYVASLNNSAACNQSFNFFDTITVFVEGPTITTGVQDYDCPSGQPGKAWATLTGAPVPGNFVWNSTPPTSGDSLHGLTPGSYTCTFTDAFGCTAQSTALVGRQGNLITLVDTSQNLRCFNDSSGALIISATNAFPPTYAVLNGDTALNGHFANLPAGLHNVSIFDQVGCEGIQPVILTQPANPLSLQIDAIQNIPCYGQSNGSFELSASGGSPPYGFNCGIFSNNTGIFNNLPAGVYPLSVSDANACFTLITDSIIQPDQLVVSIPTFLDISCFGNTDGTADAFVVGGTQPYAFAWSTVPVQINPTATNLAQGTYQVLVSDANACQSVASVNITEPPPLSVNTVSDTQICEGDSVYISSYAAGGTGNINYLWSPGNITSASSFQFPVTDTEYIVTVVDQRGCNDADTMNVVVFSNPAPVFSASVNTGCSPLCVSFSDLTPDPVNSWLVARVWDLGNGAVDSANSFEYCYFDPNLYDVSLSLFTDKGCKRTLKREDFIESYSVPESDFRFNTTISDMLDPALEVENLSKGAVSYVWNFGDGSPEIYLHTPPEHLFPDTGLYTIRLKVESEHGCVDSISRTYLINPFYTFYIPNSFTPNGDGKNDVFRLQGTYISTFDMQIFDRWGNIIFSQANREGIEWDAREIPDGVYVYAIKLSDTKGKEYKYKGTLSVIR